MEKTNILVDSGAFGVWRKGDTIDIDVYANYLLANEDNYNYAINLDHIPGQFGKVPTKEEVDYAASKSWDNLKYLESKGVNTWPVFHQGEDFKWLDRMVADGYDYIGISPDNGKYITKKKEWLDEVFSALTNKNGMPIVKTHGLAVTSTELMLRYPWNSIDSATWIQVGAYGGIFVPKFDAKGEPDYTQSPYMVYLTAERDKPPRTWRSNNKYQHADFTPEKDVGLFGGTKGVWQQGSLSSGMHIESFGPHLKSQILEFFTKEDIDYEELVNDCCARSRICARVIKRTGDHLINQRFNNRSSGLFTNHKWIGKDHPGIDIPKVTVYYALSCAAIYSDILTVENIPERLFTYNILKDKDPNFLEFYAKTGVFPKGRTKKRYLYAENSIIG